jgi:hypothetical protein
MTDASNTESVPTHEPIAQDAQTLTDALEAFDKAGYTSQFKVLEFARVQCLTCREEFAAREAAMESLRRLEGASDPADMLAVVALTCPRCDARGTLILNYGPDASLEESQLFVALQDERPTPA